MLCTQGEGAESEGGSTSADDEVGYLAQSDSDEGGGGGGGKAPAGSARPGHFQHAPWDTDEVVPHCTVGTWHRECHDTASTSFLRIGH